MKKIVLFIILALPAALVAQVDRTQAPKPAPAPVIKVGEPASFTLPNGLRVFVVRNNKLPKVSAVLTFDREAIQEGDKAGMANLAGELFRRGTTKMKKPVLDEEIDYLGGSISTSALSVNAFALKKNFPKMFSLMADIVLRPSFPSDELEKIRTQELSSLAQSKEDANAIASNVVNRLMYGKNHPYGEVETEESVKKVTVADIQKFYHSTWKPNIAYLIFVGDITVEEARALATTHFGAWAKGEVPRENYPVPAPPAKTYIAIVDRPSSVQSVINIVAPIQLKPGAPDVIPATVMNSLLGNGSSGRLYKNLREQHGFTYGAYSGIKSDRLVGSFTANASVRNEKTDSSIAEFLNELNRIRKEPVLTEDVSRTKNEMSGSFARSLESPATIANFALNVARYHLPKDYYQNYLKNLATVDNAAVQAMADKYIQPGNVHIVIVGNAKEISKGLEKYGEVKYFDVYGNEKAAPAEKKIAAGVTAESVLQKSITAMGGDAIRSIKDATLTGSATAGPQKLDYVIKYVAPSGYLKSLSMGAMVLQKEMAKDGKFLVMQQGAEQKVEPNDEEELKESTQLSMESYLLATQGYAFTLKGIEQVDGKDAYNIEIKSPKGRTFNNYYDVASGLRVKESRVQEAGPGMKVTVDVITTGYKTVNGVQFPVSQRFEAGQFKLDFVISDVKVNTGLKLEDLK